MKFKFAVPNHILTPHQIDLIEKALAVGILGAVVRNFPNWKERVDAGAVFGGEIIIQDTDYTRPITGLRPGIHLTISLVSFMPGRDFDGLANDVIRLVKRTVDEDGNLFMKDIRIFAQMTLDTPVAKKGTNDAYTATGDGLSLLEYEG